MFEHTIHSQCGKKRTGMNKLGVEYGGGESEYWKEGENEYLWRWGRG